MFKLSLLFVGKLFWCHIELSEEEEISADVKKLLFRIQAQNPDYFFEPPETRWAGSSWSSGWRWGRRRTWACPRSWARWPSSRSSSEGIWSWSFARPDIQRKLIEVKVFLSYKHRDLSYRSMATMDKRVFSRVWIKYRGLCLRVNEKNRPNSS